MPGATFNRMCGSRFLGVVQRFYIPCEVGRDPGVEGYYLQIPRVQAHRCSDRNIIHHSSSDNYNSYPRVLQGGGPHDDAATGEAIHVAWLPKPVVVKTSPPIISPPRFLVTPEASSARTLTPRRRACLQRPAINCTGGF